MITWFIFAVLSALGYSVFNALSKRASEKWPKTSVVFWSALVSSVGLFLVSYLKGFPTLGDNFWFSVTSTALINLIAFPLLLKAYQLGDFSSVFPMLFLTPAFMLGTSRLILGEAATIWGTAGMLVTLLGLFMVARSSNGNSISLAANSKGMFLGLIVAFLYSISTNFDKLTVLNSDAIFGPAVAMGLISLGMFLVVAFSGKLLVLFPKEGLLSAVFGLPGLIGLVLIFDLFVFFTALKLGLASYTILVKRTGIIAGVLWGWLFFKERNIFPKLIGSLVAVGGIAIILLAK